MTDVVKQCKTCPWRVGCVPERDIPNYKPGMHCGLTSTIKEGLASISQELRIMACHYSRDGAEFPCAGWLENQLGPGNNIGVRLGVITGLLPRPETDGPQHATFADTLPRPRRRRRR